MRWPLALESKPASKQTRKQIGKQASHQTLAGAQESKRILLSNFHTKRRRNHGAQSENNPRDGATLSRASPAVGEGLAIQPMSSGPKLQEHLCGTGSSSELPLSFFNLTANVSRLHAPQKRCNELLPSCKVRKQFKKHGEQEMGKAGHFQYWSTHSPQLHWKCLRLA